MNGNWELEEAAGSPVAFHRCSKGEEDTRREDLLFRRQELA
jgi:hypothetical protein